MELGIFSDVDHLTVWFIIVYHSTDHILLIFANQVREVKPDVLLGLSAVGGLFSKEVSGRIYVVG
jgi:malic enzyme